MRNNYRSFTALFLMLCLILALPAVGLAAETEREEPDWGLGPLPDEWFADAVFVGDSISFILERQCELTGDLGDALFISESSLNIRSAVWGQLELWLQGRLCSLEDALPLIGAKKAFIMLGTNDIGQDGGIELTMELWDELVGRIREKDPEVQLFIQSCLPMYEAMEYEDLNNALLREYNEQLKAMCETYGFVYVDLADYFRDETGGVAEKFTADHYVHINFDAAALWVEQLRNPANYSMDPRSF